jgi:GntR family transcriptional regulator
MLHLGPGEPVARKQRLLIASDRPFAVEETCLAVGRLSGLDGAHMGDWALTSLAQQHGLHLARAAEEVRLTAAPADVARLLLVEPGTVLVQLDRVISSADEAPLEWRSSACHLRGEYYHAEVN